MHGRSKPYFFAFSSEENPGSMTGHCVRIETQVLPASAVTEGTTFTILGADLDMDPRIRLLLLAAYRTVKGNPKLFPEAPK